MRRFSAFALPLAAAAAAVAACGGSSSARSQPQAAAAAARAAIRVLSPGGRTVLAAQRYGKRQLRAVVRLAGSAAAGQQMSLRGSCGGLSCDGITFADSRGRWSTRLELVTPRGRSRVRLIVAYADPRAGESPTRRFVRLRRAAAPPEVSPSPQPPAKPTPTTGGQAAPTGGGAPYGGTRTMIVIGDSLAVGMARPLGGLLRGWDVAVDARTGRPLSEGMQMLADTRLPSGVAGRRAILAFSLFTNDGPADVAALDAAVRQSVARLGAHGCAIWATIARPPLGGVSYTAANRRLKALAADPALAGRLLIVPWKQRYAHHRNWRASDNVHATMEGYIARARLYANAARSCAA